MKNVFIVVFLLLSVSVSAQKTFLGQPQEKANLFYNPDIPDVYVLEGFDKVTDSSFYVLMSGDVMIHEILFKNNKCVQHTSVITNKLFFIDNIIEDRKYVYDNKTNSYINKKNGIHIAVIEKNNLFYVKYSKI